MKFSQIIIAFALGCLVFGGIFMAESSRKAVFQSLQNPFESDVELPEFLILKESEPAQKFFTSQQEMWQMYGGSHVDFSDNKREIVNGAVFAGFNFITEAQFERLGSFTTNSFEADTFMPQVGQIKIGKIGINAPGASIFIERDKDAGKTKVYTYDHAIELWFPEASQPFVMPAMHQLEINDNTIDRLGKLYYTKLRKDLRLKIFDPQSAPNDPKAEALSFRQEKFSEIENYAQQLPLSLTRFNPNSMAGDLAASMKYLQKDFALGIPQSLRMQYEFESLLTDFLSAHFHHEDNNLVKAQQSVNEFLELQNSAKWRTFLIANPKYNNQWEFLAQNQKIWLSQSFEDNSEYVFAPIWFGDNGHNSFSSFEKHFFELEDMSTNNLNKKAKNKIVSMQIALSKINVSKEDVDGVTRIRRLLKSLITTKEALQSEVTFKLLEDLIKLEISLYSMDDPIQEEIVLENAQDVLFFLKDFIADASATNINETLVSAYTILEVDEIESRLNRSIFSTTEKQTIDAVRSFKTDNLTDEQKAQIAKDKELYDSIVGEIEDIDDGEVIDEVVYDEGLTDTEEEFTEMLNLAGVYTEGMSISVLNPTGPKSFQFRGAYYQDYQLSGNFRVTNQSFTQLNMKGIVEKNVNPRFLAAILRSMNDELEEQKIIAPIETGPANDTPLAIIQRKLVQEIFEQEGLQVNRGKEYRLKFIYFKKEEYVTNLVVEYVRNRFEFGDQIIPRKGIKDFVTSEVEKRFEVGDTNPGR